MGGRTASTATDDGGAGGTAAPDNTVREKEEGLDAMELWWRWLKSLASSKLFGTLMSGNNDKEWMTDGCSRGCTGPMNPTINY